MIRGAGPIRCNLKEAAIDIRRHYRIRGQQYVMVTYPEVWNVGF
jgi:hypothetical protein